jgi:hypothetical protein
MTKRIATSSLLAIAALLIFAAPAMSASVRYAEPGGDGPFATCPSSDPCSLTNATSSAYTVDGDEVVLLPGVYSQSATQVTIDEAVNVHGTGAPSDTRIISSSSVAVRLGNAGTYLSDVQIESAGGSSALQMIDGTAERVVALSSEGFGCLLLGKGTIRSSACIGTHPTYGTGLSDQATAGANLVTLRNVTAIGVQYGLNSSTSNPGTVATINAKSVIIKGGLKDIIAVATTGTTLTVTMDHSNYSTTDTSGPGTKTITSTALNSNQTAAPIFVNATANDFHQAASSPTVDAGVVDGSSGTTDFDRQARTSGAAPDIGADEFYVAPTPPVIPAVAPVTKISKKPKKKSSVRKAKFKFAKTEPGLKFKCKLDKGKYKTCSSTYSKTVKVGKHKLSVYAISAAGLADATPAIYKWTVTPKK